MPIFGELTPGTTQRHLIKLPGAALANDEPRPVISVAGAKPGPVLFVNAGVHGGEYPAVEAVIRLGKTLDPKKISGTVILMPVLNLPAFRTRTPFVCPIDNVNPNRVFPGDPRGSYSEQMTHACINEFVVHADAYVDLHGGDIPEALVPFVICSEQVADSKLLSRSKAIAMAFGLPYVLTVSKPVQPSKGHRAGAGGLSSYAAAADKGIPAILAEAGGAGQMQEEAVSLLVNGVVNVMRHLGMIEDAKFESRHRELRNKFKTEAEEDSAQRRGYNSFDEVRLDLHEEHRRLVSESRGGRCRERRRTDRHGRRFVWRHSGGNCFAGERRCTFSDDQSIRAREWVTDGNRGGIESDQSV